MLPQDIIYKIILCKGFDIISICNISNVNKEFYTAIQEQWHDIITNIFIDRFPLFTSNSDMTSLFQSDVNLKYLFNILENIESVSKMKKQAKYKHLLKHICDGKLFYLKATEDKHDRELATVRVLLDFYNYVKTNHAIENQIYQKVDLSIWAVYPLFLYISLKLSNDSVFKESYRPLAADNWELTNDHSDEEYPQKIEIEPYQQII